MGILKHLLFWPVTGPLFLTRFSLEKVEGVARDELTDDARIKEELLELQLRLELEEIDDETYVREEARLMEALREVVRWREAYGLGTRGGVVRVAGEEEAEEAQAGAGHADALSGGATLEVSLPWDDQEPSDEGEER